MAESQECTMLRDTFYDDPSQLSQLLRQRAGSHFVYVNDSVNAKSASEGLPSPQRAPAALSLSPTRAPSRRVRFNPNSRHVTPSLSRHNSAPVSTGESLTEKEYTRKIYHTFNGTMDVPGDTQVDPDIFKEFTSGILGSNSMLGVPPQPPLSAVEEGSSESARDFVIVSSQEQRAGGRTSPMTINDDPETQPRAHYAETSPLKLLETPATYTHKKQDSQGQELSSVARTNTTPGTALSASAFFGFGESVDATGMSLTQAFNATQAKTSPAVGNLNDDVVFQRPSPNFAHPRQSSPSAIQSSPLKARHRKEPATDPALRSSSEPRADYESIKQSQERRSRERASMEMEMDVDEQDSWEQPTDVGKHYAQQKAKERFEREAAKSLARVSAPTSSARRPLRRELLSTRATTSPKKTSNTTNSVRSFHYGPYDGTGADGPYELSQTLPRSRDGEDSPDGLSGSAFNRRPARAIAVEEIGIDQGIQVPHTSSHPVHTLSGHSLYNSSLADAAPSQTQPESQVRASMSQPGPKNISRLRSSKETEVVMDSQPNPEATFGASQPAPLRLPSSPSINQYSINQTTMLRKPGLVSSPISSVPPMPPKSSSPAFDMMADNEDTVDGAGERVPSSPPIVRQEDDITYDEHAYEEHSDDERGEREAQVGDDDVEMDGGEDGDDLPTPRYDLDAEPGSEDQAEDDERTESPRKDDEVPETIDQEHVEDDFVRLSHPDESASTSPRAKCQPVPESQMLEATQPSYFPDEDDTTQLDAPADAVAHGTEAQHQSDTAREPQSVPLVDEDVNSAADEDVTAPSPVTTKGPSLLDIANQPDTQRSVELDELDLPQLSVDEDPDDPLDAIMARQSPYHPQKKRRTTYTTKKTFRSPIKETDPLSEQLTSSPQHGASYTPGWSPPTTQDQEARGARTAVRAMNSACITHSTTSKSNSRSKSDQPQTPRNGALKTVNEALFSKSLGKTSPKAATHDRNAKQDTPTPSTAPGNVDVDMLDAKEESMQDSDASSIENGIKPTSGYVEVPSGKRLMPNRVFASWPGNGYYPATCIGRVDNHRLRVRYDDGNTHPVEATQVRALDLRPGDQVKIDVQGMKKMPYVVVGFKDKNDQGEDYPATTCHGYATVVLEEKQRESLSAEASKQAKKQFEVSVDNIYLTTQLFLRLKDRMFQYKAVGSPRSSPRIGTPKPIDATTPATTDRRRSTKPSLLRGSVARSASVASSVRSSGKVFSNMAFAITSTNDAVNKGDLSKLIMSNGGLVVDEGFHELFDTNAYAAPASSGESAEESSSSMHGLKLKQEHEDLRFVALLAQSHSRSPKFIQALSLNIPCLHLRWIQDTIAAGRALPFAKYLLPAGTSTFLDPEGVVRSRDMPTFDPTSEDASFAQMVKDRNLLFRNESVLVVAEDNAHDPYLFLTHAMGAADMGQCSDLEEAKESVDSGAWDWIYFDCKPDELADVAAEMFSVGGSKGKTSRKKATKKRKRDSEGTDPGALVKTGFVGENKIKVVCGEFVIQSLILGALAEE